VISASSFFLIIFFWEYSLPGCKIYGQHKGLVNYTIGQRKGLGSGNAEPIYVVEKKNRYQWVGHRLRIWIRQKTVFRDRIKTGFLVMNRSIRFNVKLKSATTQNQFLPIFNGTANTVIVQFDTLLRDIARSNCVFIKMTWLCSGMIQSILLGRMIMTIASFFLGFWSPAYLPVHLIFWLPAIFASYYCWISFHWSFWIGQLILPARLDLSFVGPIVLGVDLLFSFAFIGSGSGWQTFNLKPKPYIDAVNKRSFFWVGIRQEVMPMPEILSTVGLSFKSFILFLNR